MNTNEKGSICGTVKSENTPGVYMIPDILQLVHFLLSVVVNIWVFVYPLQLHKLW